ncbi:hypothetical protein OG264_38625 (plasmid) [Streptomyces xanthophaeus]|uniref:hypothetical protein n=1 Tax=Streptomyces xanthophaeus TaxID=67385 RepID=UPI002F9109FC|nr:hypothetical protein OG264_38625 [Streptomyces xanthophaeus]WST65814.1 hypothetical protein OG605_40270 [Streptomyces xanthophaeus]
METPEQSDSLVLTPEQLDNLTSAFDQIRPALVALASVPTMNESLIAASRTVGFALAQIQADTEPIRAMTQQMVVPLVELAGMRGNVVSMGRAAASALALMEAEVAPVRTVMQRTLTALAPALSALADMSSVRTALQQATETAAFSRQEWFMDGVQTLYASDLLDRLDDDARVEPTAVPSAEEMAELDAVAQAFRRADFLTPTQAKRLFIAWLCCFFLALWALAAVSAEGPAKDTLGSAADTAGLVAVVAPVAIWLWKQRSPRSSATDETNTS